MHLYYVLLTYLAFCYKGGASELTDSVNCFSLNLYKVLAGSNSNLIASPFSVDVVLSLLLTASGGNTAAQLSNVLRYKTANLTLSDMKNAYKAVLADLKSNYGNTLKTADSVWLQKGLSLKNDFQTIASDYFNTTVDDSLDFQGNPKSATDTINNWAKANTDGLVNQLFDDQLPTDTLMVLANALYFKGFWAKKFDTRNTYPQKFYNNGNQTQGKNVPVMNQKQYFSYKYDSNLNAEVLEMEYKGGETSMFIFLPSEQSSLEEMENAFTCDNFQDSYTDLYNQTVIVTVPKFTAQSALDLKQPLKDLGITDLFDTSGGADLSGLINSQQDLAVGDIIQKAVVKVDEDGSVAAAVTAARICRSCLAAVVNRDTIFRADRPFSYIILHKPTGLILFMGRVSSL